MDQMNETQPHRKHFFKFLKILVVILSIFAAVKTISALKEYSYIGQGVMPTNVITVAGTGDVLATPDIANFSFTVSKDATTAADAQTKVAALINPALAAIKAAGVADADVSTASYNLYPKYGYDKTNIACPVSPGGAIYPCPGGNQVIVGYTVSETIEVKVRKIDSATAIISQVTALGVSDLSGPNFTTDDPTALQDQARAKAINDAKARAQTLAKELGVSLGRIVSFSDNQGGPIYYAQAYGTDSIAKGGVTAPAPELPQGQNKISANVSITYEIK